MDYLVYIQKVLIILDQNIFYQEFKSIYYNRMRKQNFKFLPIIMYLLSGTFLLTLIKLQGTQKVQQGTYQKKFFHPYMQTFVNFFGQVLYLLLYFIEKPSHKKQIVLNKKPFKSNIFILPAVADTLTSILQLIALTYIPGSTFLMFKGTSIITTLIFSKLLNKKQLQKRHYIGCSISILGIFIVGATSFFDQSEISSDHLMGYICMFTSIIFNGFSFAYEQYLVNNYHVNIYQIISFQGLYGMSMITIIVSALSFIPCNLGPKICIYDSSNNGFFQSPMIFFQQLLSNQYLLYLTIGVVFFIGIFILNGIKITKMYDALTKSLINITKTMLVWIVGILITVYQSGNKDYELQSLEFKIYMIKMFGFVVIILGNLIYNKIIVKDYLLRRSRMKFHYCQITVRFDHLVKMHMSLIQIHRRQTIKYHIILAVKDQKYIINRNKDQPQCKSIAKQNCFFTT